jgi:hypothetical protein
MTMTELKRVVLRKRHAHRYKKLIDKSDPINKVKCLDENLIATGDDAGCVKVSNIL